jgi:hypothetical protein
MIINYHRAAPPLIVRHSATYPAAGDNIIYGSVQFHLVVRCKPLIPADYVLSASCMLGFPLHLSPRRARAILD